MKTFFSVTFDAKGDKKNNCWSVTRLSSEKWIVVHSSIRLWRKSFQRYMSVSVNGHDFKLCWNVKDNGMILIDIQMVFDTLYHKIKWSTLVCSGKTMKWFYSSLTSRAIFVSLDNVFLEEGTINRVVPQGSILGPLLFLLYINDILQGLLDSQTYLYTGDTSDFCQRNDIDKIENVLNKETENFCEWFLDTKLSIYLVKIKLNSLFLIRKTMRSLT